MSAMTELAIDVRGLRKSYGDLEAVPGIDLQGRAGEVFVLTPAPALTDRALKRRIGIVLQSAGVEPYLTVEEVIDLFRGYYPNSPPLDEIIHVAGLRGKRKSRAGG